MDPEPVLERLKLAQPDPSYYLSPSLIFSGPVQVRISRHDPKRVHCFQFCYHSKDNIGLEWAGKYPPIIYDSLSTYCKLIRGPIGTQDSFLDYAEKDRYVWTGIDMDS